MKESANALGGRIFVLEVLGTLSLGGEGGPVPAAARQRRSLGLLALLALGRERGLSRDRIEAYLWPESPGARVRHALDQAVYAVRRALGSESILSAGGRLRLNPDIVRVDVRDFEDAMQAGRWAAAVGLYRGPLLDGFTVADAHDLETWIEAQRMQLCQEYQRALQSLAESAAEVGNHAGSVTWWRRLAGSNPLSASAAKRLMAGLAAAGDRADAVQHARVYQEFIRQELGMEPDAEIESFASSLNAPAVVLPDCARSRQ